MVPLETKQNNADEHMLTIHWAQTAAEIEEVQRLRFQVFANELGVTLHGADGIDSDQFDELSLHLYVRNQVTGEVIGTYRIITPDVAAITGWYTAQEFDLSTLIDSGIPFMEAGRACVHRDFRHGSVVLMLWKAILQYAKQRGYAYVIGCSSVQNTEHTPSIEDVKTLFIDTGANNSQFAVKPLHPFTPEMQVPVAPDVKVALPALLKGYLRLGGKFCGDPAYDADFHCADFFTILALADVSPRYARHFELLD